MRITKGGWSVVEALIGVAAVTLIFLLSAPVLDEWSQAHNLRKTSKNLYVSLTMAQQEATKRGDIARLCPSSDGWSCRPDGDWNRGWIVFLDSNANKQPEPAEIMNTYGPPGEQIRIHALGSFTSSADFGIDGMPIGTQFASAGGFQICSETDEPSSREILIDEQGRPEVSKSDDQCREISTIPQAPG